MKKKSVGNKNELSPILFYLLVISFGVMIFSLAQNGYIEISSSGLHFPMSQQSSFAGSYMSKGQLLKLNTDGTAMMNDNFGVWKKSVSGFITVNLNRSNLSFVSQEVNGVKELRQVDFDKDVWGENGLVLQNIEPLVESKWVWSETKLANGTGIKNVKGDKFSLVFDRNGKLLVGTDCNNMNASFELNNANSLTIASGASTKKYCMNSNEIVFLKYLMKTNSYSIKDAKLNLYLANDTGVMTFLMTK